MDAGYSAAALTAALAGQPVHLLIRLASGSVFYADPITWPGKKGRPGKHGMAVACGNNPGQANPEPDETLVLPDTPRYGTVRVGAWREVHPLIHGDRGYFAGWDGKLPVLRGTVLRVTVEHLPDGRAPHKTMWLWHAGPARSRSMNCGAPTWPASTKNTPLSSPRPPSADAAGSAPPSKPTGGSAWSWPPSPSCCWPARTPSACAAPGKPGPRPAVPCPRPGPPRICKHAATWAPPPMSLNRPASSDVQRFRHRPGTPLSNPEETGKERRRRQTTCRSGVKT